MFVRDALLLALLLAGSVSVSRGADEHAKPLFERDVATGDWGGTRSALESDGVTFGLHYTQEYLGIVDGGFRSGGEYNALTELDLDFDLGKLTADHWHGATVHASFYDGIGDSLSGQHIGDDSDVSNINMRNTVRLFECYVEQKLGDHFSIRAGMIVVDSQFNDTGGGSNGSLGGNLFINSDLGVSPILTRNLPIPTFPISGPAVVISATPTNALTLRAAIFDGNASPNDYGDPTPGFVPGTKLDDHGFDFDLRGSDGAFVIAEATYELNKPATASASNAPADGKSTEGKTATGPLPLGGLYKIGGFYHTDTFTRWRDGAGVHGDAGGYLLMNQMLWHENQRDNQGLSFFGRLGMAQPDRSALDFTCDGGLVYRGLIPGHDDDQCGIGLTSKEYSRDFSEARQRAGKSGADHETIFEFTYKAQVAPWFSIQPDAQYVLHPAGNHDARDALVAGLRVSMDF